MDAATILSRIEFSSVTQIVTAAGLALIALGFLTFVLTQAANAANGCIGDESSSSSDYDEDYSK